MLTYNTIDEKDLYDALHYKEFALAFQPIMNLETDNFETFESFIRWHHPTLGTLPPSFFMQNLEKYNLNEAMTSYIFECAVEQIMNNSQSGYGETGVNVNLTPQEFYNPQTIIQLAKAIERLPNPEFFGVEISPKVLTAYAEQYPNDTDYHPDNPPSDMELNFLDEVKSISEQYVKLGVTIALDTTDYVIGSLIRSDILGFHAVKISTQSLQQVLLKDNTQMKHYVQAAKDFQIPIIAVGIEDEKLFKVACENGLSYAQGMFFCPPLCLNEPKKFNSYLESYFSVKSEVLPKNDLAYDLKKESSELQVSQKDMVQINQSIDSLKQISSELQATQNEILNLRNNFDENKKTDLPIFSSQSIQDDEPKSYTYPVEEKTEKMVNQQRNAVRPNIGFGNRPTFGRKSSN